MKFRISVTMCLMSSLVLGACADTGQEEVMVPLFVAGVDVSEPIVATGDIPVTLDRAELAFGPLYLCAGATAGDLCDTARLEWLGTAVVDATDPTPARAGDLWGVSGTVRSWMYDYGISSQLTQDEPYILEAARALGDTSLVLEGRAQVDGIELPFTASVPIQQTGDTELGVPVVRKSSSDVFNHEVQLDEPGLVVRFNPETWVRSIDFRVHLGDEACTEEGPTIACDGTVERRCDGPVETESRDCASLGQICALGQGCADAIIFDSSTVAYRALRNGLLSGVRPTFDWNQIP